MVRATGPLRWELNDLERRVLDAVRGRSLSDTVADVATEIGESDGRVSLALTALMMAGAFANGPGPRRRGA